MNTIKDEVQSLLNKLPDDCTLENVQYHLYVLEKIHRGIERAKNEGTTSQEEIKYKYGTLGGKFMSVLKNSGCYQ